MNRKLLKTLVCPKCHHSLEYNKEVSGLQCVICSLIFPIRDEIPIMLVEEATYLKSKVE